MPNHRYSGESQQLRVDNDERDNNDERDDNDDTNLADTPFRNTNQIDTDGLREISEGIQHGCLASQHQTDHNDSPYPNEESKEYEDQVKEVEPELNASVADKQSDTNSELTPFAFKRGYGSQQRKVLEETSSKNTSQVVKDVAKPEIVYKQPIRPKPFCKSIMAITAAIVLQNFWREYRNRKAAQNQDCGTSVLEVLKRKIEANTTMHNQTHQNMLGTTSMMETARDEHKMNINEPILENISDHSPESPSKSEIENISLHSESKHDKSPDINEDSIEPHPNLKNSITL